MKLYKKTIVVWCDVPGEGDEVLETIRGWMGPADIHGTGPEVLVENAENDPDITDSALEAFPTGAIEDKE